MMLDLQAMEFPLHLPDEVLHHRDDHGVLVAGDRAHPSPEMLVGARRIVRELPLESADDILPLCVEPESNRVTPHPIDGIVAVATRVYHHLRHKDTQRPAATVTGEV